MRRARRAGLAVAALAATAAAGLVGAGTASAAPAAYAFQNGTMQQTFAYTDCPSWVSFTSNCLAVTVTGTGTDSSGAYVNVTFTGVVALASASGDTRAERRGTIATPTGPVQLVLTGTYNPANGSATYPGGTYIPPNGSSFASLKIDVDIPTSYDPATGSGAGTESWNGKIGTS